jgi:hypothetical protein
MKLGFIAISFLLLGSNSFAGGLRCTLEGCTAICGSLANCLCDPAEGYTCRSNVAKESLNINSILARTPGHNAALGCRPCGHNKACCNEESCRKCEATNP